MNSQKSGKKTGARIMSILGIILCVILIPVLVVNITIIVKTYTNPGEVPSFMGYKPFIVLSNSMKPGINAGDIVLARETDADSLNIGDIIAYKEGNGVVTHRITGIVFEDGKRQFITKGDANNTEDLNPVSADMVEGSFLLHIPKMGDFALFMQTPVGMLVCIGLPLTLFVLYDILRRRSFDRQKLKVIETLEKELEKKQEQSVYPA